VCCRATLLIPTQLNLSPFEMINLINEHKNVLNSEPFKHSETHQKRHYRAALGQDKREEIKRKDAERKKLARSTLTLNEREDRNCYMRNYRNLTKSKKDYKVQNPLVPYGKCGVCGHLEAYNYCINCGCYIHNTCSVNLNNFFYCIKCNNK
jgi:hypothetical protein